MPSLADHQELVGFFSYSRDDDEDSQGGLSALRDRIQRELRGQLGRSPREFRLWQDKQAIGAGRLWQAEIETAIEQAVFFIPIITPTAVRSEFCRFEFEAFRAREQRLRRNDLIFPILYIRVPGLEDSVRRDADPVLKMIAQRQYVDWRTFRHRDVHSPAIGEAIEHLCTTIVEALVAPQLSEAELERLRRQEEYERAEAARRRQQDEEERRAAEAERLRQEKEARERAEAEQLRQQEEEHARAESERLRQQEEERARAEAERQRQQEEERARAEAAQQRREEEERARAEAERLRQQQEERARAEAARQRQQEEERAQAEAALLRQQEEERTQAEAALQRQQEEEQARAAAERLRREEANRSPTAIGVGESGAVPEVSPEATPFYRRKLVLPAIALTAVVCTVALFWFRDHASSTRELPTAAVVPREAEPPSSGKPAPETKGNPAPAQNLTLTLSPRSDPTQPQPFVPNSAAPQPQPNAPNAAAPVAQPQPVSPIAALTPSVAPSQPASPAPSVVSQPLPVSPNAVPTSMAAAQPPSSPPPPVAPPPQLPSLNPTNAPVVGQPQPAMQKLPDTMVAAAPAPAPRLPPKPTSRPTADLAKFRDCPDCPEMVVLSAGGFWMGSDAVETDGEGLTPTEAKREQPRHRVTVSKFAIEKYPVTVGEYRKFVEYRKSKDPTDNREGGCAVGNPMRWEKANSWRDPGFPQDDNHPVVCVSWQDAQDYAAWLSELAGHRYRLPTEAEWEYAARGNQKTSRFWGNDMVPGKTNCDGCGDTAWDNKSSAPVRGPNAIYPANPFGLYSTIGNVFQWVEDCRTESYEAADLAAPKCEFRIQRGGSWLTYAKKTRAAYRTWSEVKWRGNYIGFRLATDLP